MANACGCSSCVPGCCSQTVVATPVTDTKHIVMFEPVAHKQKIKAVATQRFYKGQDSALIFGADFSIDWTFEFTKSTCISATIF